MDDLVIYCLKFQSTRVFFGFAAVSVASATGSDREGARAGLVTSLLGAMSKKEPLRGQRNEDRLMGFRVVHDGIGRPELILGGARSFPVSFSYSGRRLWAAMTDSPSSVGIDAARADEFPMGYPFARAFRDEELMPAMLLIPGGIDTAAAVLWSAKEAAVKALGCGFHLLDPLEIMATNQTIRGEMFECNPVVQSEKASKQTRFADGRVMVRSMKLGTDWVSVAVSDLSRSEAHGVGCLEAN